MVRVRVRVSDVPVYVVFLQGVLTVPVLLPAHAGAQETLRHAAVACQGTNLTAKRGLKAPFVAKFDRGIFARFPIFYTFPNVRIYFV